MSTEHIDHQQTADAASPPLRNPEKPQPETVAEMIQRIRASFPSAEASRGVGWGEKTPK